MLRNQCPFTLQGGKQDVKVAEQSPRICKDGSIRWYAGDTFVLTLVFNITDESGNPMDVSDDDSILVYFQDYRSVPVVSFTSNGSTTIDINMDKEKTKHMKEGLYTLHAKFNGKFVTTLLHNNKVVVE